MQGDTATNLHRRQRRRVVLESINAGTDLVRTRLASYRLTANVENLDYTGAGNFSGTGNVLANAITGGNGHDSLDGGAGADALSGGMGNDTYVVDNIGDAVAESANAGTDLVRTTLQLHARRRCREPEYLGPSTAGFIGTGNALNNTILGWNGADRLDGGIGADTMRGYDGNDLFYVDNIGDTVLENANEGTDTVVTTLTSYTLTANVENVTYNGNSGFSTDRQRPRQHHHWLRRQRRPRRCGWQRHVAGRHRRGQHVRRNWQRQLFRRQCRRRR